MDVRLMSSAPSLDAGWPHPDADGAAAAELVREGVDVAPDLDVGTEPPDA